MTFTRIVYADLNHRQKENYNFHKVAARLADYGYHSIRLSDDFHGADFIALHVDGESLLRVQLKGRLDIQGKYEGRGLHVAFIEDDRVYVYPHDEVVALIEKTGRITNSKSWAHFRGYSWPRIPKWAREFLNGYEI